MTDGSKYKQEQFVKDCRTIVTTVGRKIDDHPIIKYAYWGDDIKISGGSLDNHVSLTYEGKTYYPNSTIGTTAFKGIPDEVKSIVLRTVVNVEG